MLNSTVIGALTAAGITGLVALENAGENTDVERCRIATEFLKDDKSDNGTDSAETKSQIKFYERMRDRYCNDS